MNFSIIEQLAELESEIRRRRRHYPSWVKSGALDADSCELRIGRLEAAAETLRRLIALAIAEEIPPRPICPNCGIGNADGICVCTPSQWPTVTFPRKVD